MLTGVREVLTKESDQGLSGSDELLGVDVLVVIDSDVLEGLALNRLEPGSSHNGIGVQRN